MPQFSSFFGSFVWIPVFCLLSFLLHLKNLLLSSLVACPLRIWCCHCFASLSPLWPKLLHASGSVKKKKKKKNFLKYLLYYRSAVDKSYTYLSETVFLLPSFFSIFGQLRQHSKLTGVFFLLAPRRGNYTVL